MTELKREGDAETRPFIEDAISEHQKNVLGQDAARSEACMEEIKEILEKHNCRLLPQAILSPNGAEFVVQAVPNPPAVDQMPKPVPLAQKMKEEVNARKARQVSKKSKGESRRKRKKK
jgi:hypothetical protein